MTRLPSTSRGESPKSEALAGRKVLVVGAAELRRALAELPGLGEIIVSALMMRRKRLLLDLETQEQRLPAQPA